MKLLSNSRSASLRACRAWSLVEMMVSIGIGSVVMAALMQTSLFTSRSFVAMGNYADLDRASRNCLDHMSRDIRQARVFGAQWFRTNYMVFTNLDLGYFAYHWDPANKTVNRLSGQYNPSNNTFINVQTNLMLTGCTYFSFRIWQRNPTNGFIFPYSANGSPLDTKMVDVSWRCSRRFLDQHNTESVQVAKIVLRN